MSILYILGSYMFYFTPIHVLCGSYIFSSCILNSYILRSYTYSVYTHSHKITRSVLLPYTYLFMCSSKHFIHLYKPASHFTSFFCMYLICLHAYTHCSFPLTPFHLVSSLFLYTDIHPAHMTRCH